MADSDTRLARGGGEGDRNMKSVQPSLVTILLMTLPDFWMSYWTFSTYFPHIISKKTPSPHVFVSHILWPPYPICYLPLASSMVPPTPPPTFPLRELTAHRPGSGCTCTMVQGQCPHLLVQFSSSFPPIWVQRPTGTYCIRPRWVAHLLYVQCTVTVLRTITLGCQTLSNSISDNTIIQSTSAVHGV